MTIFNLTGENRKEAGMSTTYGESDEVRENQTAVQGQVIMPFYLICDVSGSMSGDIGHLSSGIRDLIDSVKADPVVEDLTMLGIITFNHQAQVAVPLDSAGRINQPNLSASGGTNYSSAFQEYHRAFTADRSRLKAQGRKVFRPCVFFLTDGEPGDRPTFLSTFRSLFAFDPHTGTGNQAFPYFVPIGFRTASEQDMRSLAYPDFGEKGRWFLTRNTKVSDVLKQVADMLGNTVISSGQTAAAGAPRIVPPTPPAGSDSQWGIAGGFV